MKKTAIALLLLACLMGLLAPMASAAGQVTLAVKQDFSGTGTSAKTCSYRLIPKQASNPMPAGSGADGYPFSITGTDEISVGPITFTQAGQYAYELRHTTPPASGFTYDQEVYTLEMYVKSDLTVAVVVTKKDGSKAAGITFAHTGQGLLPSDPAIMVDPPVVKTVSGNPARASVFTFRLTAGSQSNPMPAGSANGVKTIQITGPGRGEFGTWSYVSEGTYYYTVSEENIGESGYTYDTAVYTITDTVKAVDGQLAVTRIVTNSANKQVISLSFINTYTQGGRPTSLEGKPGKPGPITGDEFQAVLYIALFCGAGALALASVIYLLAGKRRGKKRIRL